VLKIVYGTSVVPAPGPFRAKPVVEFAPVYASVKPLAVSLLVMFKVKRTACAAAPVHVVVVPPVALFTMLLAATVALAANVPACAIWGVESAAMATAAVEAVRTERIVRIVM